MADHRARLRAISAHLLPHPVAEQTQTATATLQHGGPVITRQLAAEGAPVVFGLPGAGQYEATDAMYDNPDVRYIWTRHEQAATYMADGYARVTGGVGAALVVPGPGFYNAAAGLISANSVHSRVLVMTGAPHYSNSWTAEGATPAEDLSMLRPLCKWAGRADTTDQVPSILHEAFTQMRSGRPGAAVVELSRAALQDGRIDDPGMVFPDPAQDPAPEPTASDVAAAAAALGGALKPLLWVGSGASGAAAEVQALAEALNCGVVSSQQGKGILSDHHPLSLGFGNTAYSKLAEWVDECDAIVLVGTTSAAPPPPEEAVWREKLQTNARVVIRIDTSPEEAEEGSTLPIVADSAKALAAICAALDVTVSAEEKAAVAAAIGALNEHRHGPEEQLQPQGSFMAAIRAALPDNGVVVNGMNQVSLVASREAARLASAASERGRSADGLLLPQLPPRLPAAHHAHRLRLRHPRLRVPHRSGRQGRRARAAGRGGVRRRRVCVQHPGARDGEAAQHRRDRDRLQRQRIRQRAPLLLGRFLQSSFIARSF